MFICSVQMSFLYKTHLDATIHWCNLPAHFWRTNYCALVKQTIWNASPLNRTYRGIQVSSSLHAAFVLLLLVLSHICLLSGLKAHQRRGKRLCSAQGNCWWCFFVTTSQVCACKESQHAKLFAFQLFEQLYGRRMCPDSMVCYQTTDVSKDAKLTTASRSIRLNVCRSLRLQWKYHQLSAPSDIWLIWREWFNCLVIHEHGHACLIDFPWLCLNCE